MNLSEDRKSVFCHGHCQKWLNIRQETFQHEENILCLHCMTHLGYEKDLPEIYGSKEE